MEFEIICPKCNSTLPPDSEFCQYCGAVINKVKTSQDNNTATNQVERKVQSKKLKKRILLSCTYVFLAVCIVVGGFFGYKNILNPAIKYNKANKLLNNKKFTQAAAIFKELDSYKDSKTLLKDTYYNQAIDFYNKKEYQKAAKSFYKQKDYKKSGEYLQKAELRWRIIGNEFTLGSYEQDGNLNNGNEPIEWIVINNTDDKVYAISKYCLDYKQFHSDPSNYNGHGDLEEWLTTEFYHSAFTKKEKNQLAVHTTAYETIETDLGVFQSKIYAQYYVGLLYNRDAKKMKKNGIPLLAERTYYALNQYGVSKKELKKHKNIRVGYWIDSSTGYMDMNIVNTENGKVELHTMSPTNYYGVRPVITIKKK